MTPNHLNVSFVESVQRAIARGKSVDAVHQLATATLPGLLEYTCLRRCFHDAVPVLPEAIHRSVLGRALAEIEPDAASAPAVVLRSTASKTIQVQQVEFAYLPTSGFPLGNVEWENFLQRFERSAKSVGFNEKSAMELLSAFGEISENAILHSQSTMPPIMGYAVKEGEVLFSVADLGIGVRASLGKNPRYADLPNDIDAIQLAIQTGVTSDVTGSGGYGFHSVFKSLAEQWGELRLRSGNGCIAMDGTGVDADDCRRSYPPALKGFQVSVCCRMTPPSEKTSAF